MSDSPVNSFEAFWRDPSNAGWFSAGDAAQVASAILATCGAGTFLDVGCGSGRLLAAMRQHAVAVRGIDASPAAVALCNAQAPASAQLGDAFALPFADASFDTVACTGLVDHLDDQQCGLLLTQLRRVARRAVVIVTGAGRWPADVGTVPSPRSRTQMHALAFEAGLRRHPAELRIVSYAALEADPLPRFMCFEPVASANSTSYPLSWLLEHHDLHGDHLRSSGRRADAHLARYALACELVREGDRVLDIACGMGYGSHMLGAASSAASVHGVDCEPRAAEYASANYAGPRITFSLDDAQLLPTIPNASADVIVSFETLEHLPQPEAFLARAAEVLRPGGRLIVSVPNQWADQTGTDPNPHHHHVYSLQLLRDQVRKHFIIERTHRQTAGGGWKHPDEPRRLEPMRSDTETAPAEWIVMIAMKSPIGAPADFAETLFPAQPADPEYNLYNFNRDYDNPALFRSMICMGPRLGDEAQLTSLAEQVLADARRGSADQGAAICVLAYQALANPDAAIARMRIEQLDAFAAASDGSPHARRWVVSGQYVAAKLLLAIGDRAAARARFESCAMMDAAVFSPLLGTKTVDAACWAGMLHAFDGRLETARTWWIRGIQEARRLAAQPWLNVIGEDQNPQPYGLLELSHVLDAASYCAGWLNAASRLNDQPGMAGVLARRQTAGDTRQYVKDLLDAKRWLQGQLAAGAANEELSAQVRRLKESLATIESSRSWLQEQVRNYKTAALKAANDYEQAQQWGKAADEGRRWLQTQLNESRDRETQQVRTIDELRAYIKDLYEGKTWLDGQYVTLSARVKDQERSIEELRTHATKLEEGKAWLDGQRATLNALVKERERTIEELRSHVAKLEEGKSWHESQAQAAQQRTTSRDAHITELLERVVAAEDARNAAEAELDRAKEHARRLLARGFLDRLLNKEPGS